MRFIILCLVAFTIFTISLSSRVIAADEMTTQIYNEIFPIGISMAYAGKCLEKLGIRDTPQSTAVVREFMSILVGMYDPIVVNGALQSSAALGISEYDKTRGLECKKMLTIINNYFNYFGLRCHIYTDGLALLEQRSDNSRRFPAPNNNEPTGRMSPLSEQKHNRYLVESSRYALADSMLNAAWRLAKTNLSKRKYNEELEIQREWIKTGKDTEAAECKKFISEEICYTDVMNKRMDDIVKLVGVSPEPGKYKSRNGEFKLSVKGATVQISGNAFNEAGNECLFDGEARLTNNPQWLEFTSIGSSSPFYLLCAKNGASIVYLGSGDSQGCGFGVDFKGEYELD